MGKSSSPQKDLIVAVAGPLTHIPQVSQCPIVHEHVWQYWPRPRSDSYGRRSRCTLDLTPYANRRSRFGLDSSFCWEAARVAALCLSCWRVWIPTGISLRPSARGRLRCFNFQCHRAKPCNMPAVLRATLECCCLDFVLLEHNLCVCADEHLSDDLQPFPPR